MSGQRSERERQVSGILLIVFAAMLIAIAAMETILSQGQRHHTEAMQFRQVAELSYSGSVFLAYLVIGIVGFFGVIGLIASYGHRDSVLTEAVRLATLGTFLISYWFWGAIWVVMNKVTLLSDSPINPPDWVLNNFVTMESLYRLAGWGRLGPLAIMCCGLALMMWRGARLLPRVAAVCFGLVGTVQLVHVSYLVLRGVGGEGDAGWSAGFVADLVFQIGEVIAFILAGASLLTEKGVFVRTRRL